MGECLCNKRYELKMHKLINSHSILSILTYVVLILMDVLTVFIYTSIIKVVQQRILIVMEVSRLQTN